MDQMEEIKQLLAEIRDLQCEHFKKWNEVIERDMERIKAAEQYIKQSRRRAKIWTMIIVGGVLAIMFFPLIRSMIAQRGITHSISFEKRYEAIEWLEKNQNPSAFASNRFHSTQKAIEFVIMLYDKGAKTVYVTNVDDNARTVKDEKGPYADTLIVVLPEDNTRRSEIFEIHSKEPFLFGGNDPESDSGEKELIFWWD